MIPSIINSISQSSKLNVFFYWAPPAPNQIWYTYWNLVDYAYYIAITFFSEIKTMQAKSTGLRLLVIIMDFLCSYVTLEVDYITENCFLLQWIDCIRGSELSSKVYTYLLNQSKAKWIKLTVGILLVVIIK